MGTYFRLTEAGKLRLRSFSWALLLIVIVPNLLFVVMAWLAGVGRSYLNLDYAVAVFVVALGFRWSGALLFLFLLLVDLLVVVGQLFPFVRFSDLLYLAKFTFISSAQYQVAISVIAVGVLAKCWVLLFFGRRISPVGGVIAFNLLVFLYMFKVYGVGGGGEDKFWRVSNVSLVSSQVVDFVRYRSSGFLKSAELKGEPFTVLRADAGAVPQWIGNLDGKALPEKLLLVVNESWGVPRDPKVQEALLQPLRAVSRGEVEQGNLSFVGATVAGELRELCQLRPNNFNLAAVTDGFGECLPNRLRRKGYRTASVHGAVSLMYDRRHWYPRVGFDESVFFESSRWPERCYSFPGACDLDLRATVGDFLRLDGKRFLYWLTLNSHAFYDQRDIREDVFDCRLFDVDSGSRECLNLKLQAQFFHGLGELLGSGILRGTAVLVVGDHEPPLTKTRGEKAVFAEGMVPWVSFVVE
ncbi:hypothetical protein SAMN05216201_101275 [Pseudomonas linyingensis]|uniref:Sulfatase N-terminal domain-containing protein n=1 Tax=Pseudomonas linyingensis TaxID=915471 RepID=A0A1H6S7F9_9PSED|nr:hypothetical protein SAMN05216201_101275 [Pseudomonas linyingensis]